MDFHGILGVPQAITSAPEAFSWDLDVMDTGAGFQPDAFTWSFDEVLEANASALVGVTTG
jgi:hypothetical protein